MANPLLFSIHQAERDGRTLKTLFSRYIGSATAPRGAILSAYRNGRKEMAELLRQEASQREIGAALSGFELSIGLIIDEIIRLAVEAGQDSAQRQLAAYLAEGIDYQAAQELPDLPTLAAAPRSAVAAQAAAIRALVANRVDIAEIVGDGTRLGIMQPAPIQRATARFTAVAAENGFSSWVGGTTQFMKQAIAGIDERTTDCCLRVHGQTQPVDSPFKLVGTPRYADEIQNPPFHDYCRTATALYLERYDDGLTEQMREAARIEQEMRGRPDYRPPHPANAFSRVRR